MANPIKGEVAFEHEGKHYVFVFGTYAQAALQRRSGLTAGRFFSRKMADWGVDDMLSLFYAGLLRHHELSEVEAADLMDALGQERVGQIVTESLTLSFPPATGAGARPTKPR